MPDGHPTTGQKGLQRMGCPFGSMTKEQHAEQQPFKVASAITQRPDSLPTPPETQEQYINDADGGDPPKEANLPPPSVTGSFSKCPIRMLDEKPPEEVAEYFETHKHEIPRSHEVCVKRYQSNEQSIRQLDAKYGNLVNMIKGLGMKHQPLLHDKDEGNIEKKPGGKVENWVEGVRPAPGDIALVNNKDADSAALEDREGHFDRPLKEVRVGESPSRPWGISVPIRPPQTEEGLSGEKDPHPVLEPTLAQPANDINGTPAKLASDCVRDHPHMVFNGPVFIGYPPEQAAAFLKQCGMSK